MARRKLAHPEQPLWLRLPLALFEFAASLKLAVVLLFAAAFVLGWATFVESRFGLRAVHFGIYGTWWFTLLNLLLGVNIFCAAAIRYPWQRHQTGFVITHVGLLTLMFGMLLSRRGGIDAQMPVWEDRLNYRAYEDSQHLELAIQRTENPAPAAAAPIEVVSIPVAAGPFNWRDFEGRLAAIPWNLAQRDRGVVYDRDDVRVEMLDYYSNAREVPVPELTLRLSNPRRAQIDERGRSIAGAETFSPVTLQVRSAQRELAGERPFGIGQRQRVGGGSLLFWLAGGGDEVAAFLDSAPHLPVGERGQVRLYVRGQSHTIDVAERLGQGRFPLGDGPLAAELVGYFATARLRNTPGRLSLEEGAAADEPPGRPAVELLLRGLGAEPARLVLFADLPEFSQQDYGQGVFGSYWFDHGQKSAAELLAGEGGSRIDILAGPADKLYYRYWNRREVVVAAELPANGERVNAFKMPIAQLAMYVEKYYPSERPATEIVPLEFDKDLGAPDSTRAARLALTVDGQREEFWLVGPPVMLLDRPLSSSEKRVVQGHGRAVSVTLPLDEIDLGFQVRLRKFQRRLDPGTSQAAFFGSVIDLVDRHDTLRALERDVQISMNAPIDFGDPGTGRSYRIFQESFRGPFPAGSELFTAVYGQDAARAQAFNSVFTVNYDPGRGVKYVGCLLVVAGIATMFYMRAYFFKPAEKGGAARRAPPRKREPALAANSE